MKDWRVKDLEDFLELANLIETPCKFFEVEENQVKATIWLRTALISWKGEKSEEKIKKLKENNFKEVEELETKRVVLEDLM
ncbi:MAG: hypothetical protein NZ942_02880 [Candidatus Aenigmarchaeota archaeon]|nr:hypothetical protein [Candidatus Aenigmarchaeota archaeon]